MHLDVFVADLVTAEALVLALGATKLRDGETSRTYADILARFDVPSSHQVGCPQTHAAVRVAGMIHLGFEPLSSAYRPAPTRVAWEWLPAGLRSISPTITV